MVIDGLALNLGRRIMIRSSTTTIGKGLKPLDVRTDLPNQIKLVVKGKKNIFIFGTNGNHMPYKKHDP
jgi:hypothetical protein